MHYVQDSTHFSLNPQPPSPLKKHTARIRLWSERVSEPSRVKWQFKIQRILSSTRRTTQSYSFLKLRSTKENAYFSSPAGDHAGLSVLMPCDFKRFGRHLGLAGWLAHFASISCVQFFSPVNWYSIYLVTISSSRMKHWRVFCLVPVRLFPSSSRSIHSVTYPRRTGGKRLDKNRTRIQDVDVISSRKRCFLFYSCRFLRDWLLPTGFESHQNVIHSPVRDKIDSALYPSISSSNWAIEVAVVGSRDPKRFRRSE